MRTVTELIQNHDKAVYVLLSERATQYRFFSDAEREGFVFANNQKPTEGACYHLMTVHQDKTIAYVSGWASNLYSNINKDKLITVDYKKYIDGDEDFYIKRKKL